MFKKCLKALTLVALLCAAPCWSDGNSATIGMEISGDAVCSAVIGTCADVTYSEECCPAPGCPPFCP